MKLYFLGTGTSTGVPQLGCACKVCTSTDPRDTRTRTSAVLETDNNQLILIDCGPDFRTQIHRYLHVHTRERNPHLPFMEREPKDKSNPPICLPAIEATLITHWHYDHIGGLDDLRPFSALKPITIYAEDSVVQQVRRTMHYCFSDNPYPGSPVLKTQIIRPEESFDVAGIKITPIRVLHGTLPIIGFRIGRLAYITDMSQMPEDEMQKLQGVETLVVNALRHTHHPSHQTIAAAINFVHKIKPKQTYLVHMCHGAGLHREAQERLHDETIHFAYDGLEITI